MTTDPHVSALKLDALALDALDRDAAERVRVHLDGCTACREDQRAAAELRAHFEGRVLPRGLPARRPHRRPWLAVPAFALVVLAIALWRWPRPPELGIKGDASWQVFANRDGRTFAVRDGTELAAGDRIRFVVLPGGARYILVVSVDGGGAVTIYHPYSGERSAAIDGDRVELEGSIVLDAAPGPERLYAVLTDEPLAAAAVKAPLGELAASGATAIRAARALPVPARAQLTLMFEKASR
jgi:hypothetical protein